MDARSDIEKRLWDLIGPPLYYCSECKVSVDVSEDNPPVIKRTCEHDAQIIAPRKSILAGEGGLNFTDKMKMTYYQLAASLTGRCV